MTGKLPVLLSVPHGGVAVPPEVAGVNLLSHAEIAEDGDKGAAGIYGECRDGVLHHVEAEVARAFVDLNRARDDFSRDGVIKTHTCWNVPVYSSPPDAALRKTLLERYYEPYHARLAALAGEVVLGVDGHTMAEVGPDVAADRGVRRPRICLGDARGASFPPELTERLADALEAEFGFRPSVNEPFSGGHITRSRPGGIPWVQVEFSREPWMHVAEKGERFLAALRAFAAAGLGV